MSCNATIKVKNVKKRLLMQMDTYKFKTDWLTETRSC